MWKLSNYLTASAKVIYDKTTDNLNYLLNMNQIENDEDNFEKLEELVKDKLIDYNNYIDVDKYNKEEDNHRIFPPVGLYEAYYIFFSEPTHIIDNIYLGSAFNAADYETLKQLNIKTVFNITKEITNYYPNDFIYIKFDIYDNNKHSIKEYLDKAFESIIHHQTRTEGNILIHCYMGASRSASVVIYYLMKTKKNNNGEYMNFDEALEYLKSKRSIINPTFRFTKDLAKTMIQ